MISLSVDAGDGETQYYGHAANELQSGIVVSDNAIVGTLNKVPGIVNFKGDTSDYHLVLTLKADGADKLETKMTGGSLVMKDYVTVTDGFCMYSITNKDQQKIYVKATKNGKSVEKIYSLTGLTLAEE